MAKIDSKMAEKAYPLPYTPTQVFWEYPLGFEHLPEYKLKLHKTNTDEI